MPNVVPIWTNYTADRTKTTQTVPGNSTQVLQGTAWFNNVKWYKIGVNQWITLDSEFNFTESRVETAWPSLRHSCRNDFTGRS